MRKGQWFGMLLMLLLVLSAAPVRGQAQPQRRGSAEEKSKASGAAAAKQQSSASNEETPNAASLPATAGLRAGTKIAAALESAVDTQTAKPGDEVTARVTKNVKQDGKVIIHKGDRLIGKIQSVEANAAGNAGSRLAIAFDQLAHGEATTELHTVISSVLSSPGEQQQQPMAGPEPMAMPMPAGGSAPAAQGGSRSGGGLLGGVSSTAGSTVGAVGSVAGNVGQAAGGTVGAATNSTLGAQSNSGATVATPRRAIHLESQAQAQNQTSASSMLSTRHGQLHLDSGTEMQFRVAGQAEREPSKP